MLGISDPRCQVVVSERMHGFMTWTLPLHYGLMRRILNTIPSLFPILLISNLAGKQLLTGTGKGITLTEG